MKLNKNFPERVYLDKRVLVNGIKRNNVNYENHLELREWIQDLIDNEQLEIPCTCESDCNLITNPDNYKFALNGLTYQFLDILNNDIIDNNLISNLNIEIVSESFNGDRAIEVINSSFYKYPLIKLIKPSDDSEVGNIDEPEEFTYKLTAICNGEEIESNISEVVIYPVSVDLEVVINEDLI